jgi:hypothetical protein
MCLLVVISLVAGIALDQWFEILILVPVMSLALVGTIAAGIARADNVWSITLMGIAVVTALQIGYLIGIWLRSFIVAASFARPSPASEATPAHLAAHGLGLARKKKPGHDCGAVGELTKAPSERLATVARSSVPALRQGPSAGGA